MCRWLAYYGSPLRLEEVLFKRERSLVDQSLHSRLGATTTNGDGFGVGWYEDAETPHTYRSAHPAWNDRNLRELAASISSPLFIAHIRASTGTPVQETNPIRSATASGSGCTTARSVSTPPSARAPARGRPVAVPVDRGDDRLGDDVLPRLDLRARGRPGRGGRADGRLRRGDRAKPRCRAPDPEDGRNDATAAACGRFATRASTTHARSSSARGSTCCARSTQRSRSSDWSPTSRGWSSRSRSATSRCVERGARVELGGRPRRPGRDPSLHASGPVGVWRRSVRR